MEDVDWEFGYNKCGEIATSPVAYAGMRQTVDNADVYLYIMQDGKRYCFSPNQSAIARVCKKLGSSETTQQASSLNAPSGWVMYEFN